MATNPYERAVIEAARSWREAVQANGFQGLYDPLFDAIEALDAHEAAQAPGEREVGWHEVAEGDQLKSVKNGKFYRVRRTLKVRGGYEIQIVTGDKLTTITRPTAAEPSATVLRGPTGDAVDLLTHVFSSGGNR